MQGNQVYVASCPDYAQAEACIRTLVEQMGGMGRFVRPGERIVLKANLLRAAPPESAICTHPAVVECAITGVPDEIRGQVVKATIILAEKYRAQAGEALVKELQDHVKRITAPYKYPRVIEFVESLPKTISGKIRRKEIRSADEK